MHRQFITLGILFFAFSNAGEARGSSDCIRFSEETRQFLTPLHGAWSGFADPTPLGKIPYDIEFTLISETKTQGKSLTNGAAVHTWDLWYTDNGMLMLDFHTTFGNSHTKGLCVTQADIKKGYLLSGLNTESLNILINIIDSQDIVIFNADIYLDNRLHVAITSSRKVKQ